MFKPLFPLLGICLLPTLAAHAQVVPAIGTFQYVTQLARTGTSVTARTLRVTQFGAPAYYTLLDQTPDFVPTKTLNYQGSSLSAIEIRDPNNDNLWLTSEMRTLGLNGKGALDAHWGLQQTLRYWHDVHNWNSFDNMGSPVTNFVNYHHAEFDVDNNETLQHPNAFWNAPPDKSSPTGISGSITFETGNTNELSVTDLSTIGHEFGHGINYGTAKLYVDGQESGPLNEGFSDIWGACVSNFAGPAFPTWDGPRSPTNSTLAIPKYYKGRYWDFNPQNVGTPNYNHQNGAVILYWFYLLSVGKSGLNELNEPYCVPGLGIATTEKIVFETEKRLASPTGGYTDATYADVYAKSLDAATALYGLNSPQLRAVQEAWYAVGVGPKRPTGYAIVAPAWNCTTNSGTFTLASPGGNGLASPVADWTITPAGIVTSTPTIGVSQITITQIPSAAGVITITATNTCAGTATVQSSQQLIVGNPAPTDIQGEYNTPPNRINAFISPVPTAQSYNWYVNNVLQSNHTTSITFRIRNLNSCDDPEVVEVQADFGGCGTSQMIRRDFLPIGCPARRASPVKEVQPAIYPNPANDYVLVNTAEAGAAETLGSRAPAGDNTITLYNGYGSEVFTKHTYESTYRLETSSLPNGIYTLRVINGNRTVRQQLVIQH